MASCGVMGGSGGAPTGVWMRAQVLGSPACIQRSEFGCGGRGRCCSACWAIVRGELGPWCRQEVTKAKADAAAEPSDWMRQRNLHHHPSTLHDTPLVPLIAATLLSYLAARHKPRSLTQIAAFRCDLVPRLTHVNAR